MFPDGMKIFSVRGVPIRLHWTFFLILPYVAFVMARRFQMFAVDAHTSREALLLSPGLWGIVLAVLLFASVLLHELGHVLVARMQGSRVRDVTLMLLGGVSHIEELSKRPRDEARMAIVGPLVSIAIAVVAYAAHLVFTGIAPDLQFGLYYLAQINLGIGLFNLLPAFPLDGGRVLRSMLEPKHGKARATVIAANVGRVLAVVMGLFGLLSGNLLLALIALFVWSGGAVEARTEMQRERLKGVSVEHLADFEVPVVFAEERLGRAAQIMLATRKNALLVRGPNGAIAVLDAARIARVPAADRFERRVSEVVDMDAALIDAATPADDALAYLNASGNGIAPVLRRGAVVGVISMEAIARYVELDLQLRPPAEPGERTSLA